MGFNKKIVQAGIAEYFLADYLKNNAGIKKIPSISLTSQLFEIKLNYTLEKADEIKKFAELGESFIESINGL